MDGGRQPQLPRHLEQLFNPRPETVADAVAASLADVSAALNLPTAMPATGIDATEALSLVTLYLRGGGRSLGNRGFLAHMDPPTPWVTWVASLLAASCNQNLLRPDTAPAARELEAAVLRWLAPVFSMAGGHMVPGSTVANLTALWAARDITGARTVVASSDSHLSIRKAAPILGLDYRSVDVARSDRPRAMSARDLEAMFPNEGGWPRPSNDHHRSDRGNDGRRRHRPVGPR